MSFSAGLRLPLWRLHQERSRAGAPSQSSEPNHSLFAGKTAYQGDRRQAGDRSHHGQEVHQANLPRPWCAQPQATARGWPATTRDSIAPRAIENDRRQIENPKSNYVENRMDRSRKWIDRVSRLFTKKGQWGPRGPGANDDSTPSLRRCPIRCCGAREHHNIRWARTVMATEASRESIRSFLWTYHRLTPTWL